MENEVVEENAINILPDEIISAILLQVDTTDVLNFGLTCKRFNCIVNNDQTLWKHNYKKKLPPEIFELAEKHGDGDWVSETKRFYTTRKQVYAEILSMSSKYYLRLKEIGLEDVRFFFELALTGHLSYYYTITALHEIIRKTLLNTSTPEQKPYTYTEMYYAKIAARHLIQTFLTLKWVKLHVNGQLTPLVVINFFVQWVDTDKVYCDQLVQKKIDDLVKKVEINLDTNHPSRSKETLKERIAKGRITERDILTAISQVMYCQPYVVVISATNVDTLNISRVLDRRCGNPIAVGALYDAVAKRFGVNCDLIAFPNHLFLEWRDESDESGPKVYTIDIESGEIKPKRQCPFSQRDSSKSNKYYPDALLQYTYSAFHVAMGAIINGHSKNALYLLDFLGTDDNALNPYRNFLPYLLDQQHPPGPIDMNCLSTAEMNIIKGLANLNPLLYTEIRERVVKRRHGAVRYAVGMLCCHRKLEYVCMIRNWDAEPRPEHEASFSSQLEFGIKQPFYEIIALDQSQRYVAQENLTLLTQPTRMYHLEDAIAREFSHFDGFAYYPNDEKLLEYPDDGPVVDHFREKFRCLRGKNQILEFE